MFKPHCVHSFDGTACNSGKVNCSWDTSDMNIYETIYIYHISYIIYVYIEIIYNIPFLYLMLSMYQHVIFFHSMATGYQATVAAVMAELEDCERGDASSLRI